MGDSESDYDEFDDVDPHKKEDEINITDQKVKSLEEIVRQMKLKKFAKALR